VASNYKSKFKLALGQAIPDHLAVRGERDPEVPRFAGTELGDERPDTLRSTPENDPVDAARETVESRLAGRRREETPRIIYGDEPVGRHIAVQSDVASGFERRVRCKNDTKNADRVGTA